MKSLVPYKRQQAAITLKTSQLIALQKLGLFSDTETIYHPLGTLKLSRSPNTVIDEIVQHYLNGAEREIDEARAELPPRSEYRPQNDKYHEGLNAIAAEVLFLDFDRYQYLVKRIGKMRMNTPVSAHFETIFHPRLHQPTRQGWFHYLKEVSPVFDHILNTHIPIVIPEKSGSHIPTSWPPPALVKPRCSRRFAHGYYQHPTYCSVVVVDPAGDFAEQIAKWKENVDSDRLIYVAPDLDLSMTPTINPFEIAGIKPSDTSRASHRGKDRRRPAASRSLEEVLSEGEGGESLLEHADDFGALHPDPLDMEGATLRDLHRFMDDGNNQDLVERGRRSPSLPRYQDLLRAQLFATREERSVHQLHFRPYKERYPHENAEAFFDGRVCKSDVWREHHQSRDSVERTQNRRLQSRQGENRRSASQPHLDD